MKDQEFLLLVELYTNPDIKRGPAHDAWLKMRHELARRLGVEFDEMGFSTSGDIEQEVVAAEKKNEVVPGIYIFAHSRVIVAGPFDTKEKAEEKIQTYEGTKPEDKLPGGIRVPFGESALTLYKENLVIRELP